MIDPNRDIEQYLRAADAEGLRISHVTETHIHADFVSGSRELAARTGAQLYLSDEGGADWKYQYARDAGAVLLTGGAEFLVGNVRIEAVHTPGHTPEHLSFLVTDTAAASEPMAIVTGDFVFVGDVGRPDLLERAAHIEGTMVASARVLYQSLQRFKRYPDYLQIWPGHGAGSACGKGLSAVPQSTVGYERRFNWSLAIDNVDEFVRLVLAGQPEPPAYFADMKRINKEGPRPLNGFPGPRRLEQEQLQTVLQSGAIVVDTRPAVNFAAGHIRGTINIPLNRSYNTWAGWLMPYDRPFYLIVDDECSPCLDEAVRDLAMIGLDQVAGYIGSRTVSGWANSGHPLDTVSQMNAKELAERRPAGDVMVLDVRGHAEWESGHVPGAVSVPLGYLGQQSDQLPRDGLLVVHCQSGSRSAIAASVLRSMGFDKVVNLTGGLDGWRNAGYPVEAGQSLEAVMS